MPLLNLTKRNIDAISPTEKQQETYRDPKDTGFCLRVFKSGRKVFMLEYRMPGSTRKQMLKLDGYGALTPDAARKLACNKKSDISKGIDPKELRKKAAAMPTFKAWVDDYLEDVRKRKKRPDSDERFLALASDRYGHKKMDKVTRADVQSHMALLKETGKTNVTANRYHSSVRACLNEAVRAGYIGNNVSANIRHYPEPTPRSRTLTDKEMKRLLDCIDNSNDVFVKTALHMLIESGARKSEVLSARWDDIQFEDGLWRLPETKSGKPQIMPLSASIMARLRLLPRTCDWLFPTRHGDGHRKDLKKPWDAIRTAAEIPDVTMHDVRRTFGLHIARSAGLHVASKLLRHSSIKVTESHYAPLGIDELRSALEKHSADVVPILKGKSGGKK